jgi:hypothetical protein
MTIYVQLGEIVHEEWTMNNSNVFISACRLCRQADFIMTSFRGGSLFFAKMIKFSIKYKNNNT